MAQAKAWITLTAVGLLLTAVSGTQVAFQQWPWNLNADPLVLALGSFWYKGRAPMPNIGTSSQCRDWCSWIGGCNGWSFCNKTEGCGGGCKAFASAHPQLRLADGNVDSRYGIADNTTMKDVAQRPGPWEGLCQYGSPGDDKWAFATCTLKVVKDTKKPVFWGKNPADGWVSGVIHIPSTCGRSFAAATCQKCLKLTSKSKAAGCVACAKAANKLKFKVLGNPVLRTIALKEPVTSEACPKCYELKSASYCVGCVKKGKTCAKCAWQRVYPWSGVGEFDVGTCFACVQQSGEKVLPACQECSYKDVVPGAQRFACVKCVDTIKSRICPFERGQGDLDCVEQQACRLCSLSPQYAKNCTTCLAAPKYNPDCTACAQVPAARQKTCFTCASKITNFKLNQMGACAVCMSLPVGQPADDCVKNCALRKDLSLNVSKNYCQACWDTFPTKAGQNTCYDCLVKNPQADAYPYAMCGLSG